MQMEVKETTKKNAELNMTSIIPFLFVVEVESKEVGVMNDPLSQISCSIFKLSHKKCVENIIPQIQWDEHVSQEADPSVRRSCGDAKVWRQFFFQELEVVDQVKDNNVVHVGNSLEVFIKRKLTAMPLPNLFKMNAS